MKTVKDGLMCSMDEEPVSLEQRLRRLEDAEEIREILYHYTRCVKKTGKPIPP